MIVKYPGYYEGNFAEQYRRILTPFPHNIFVSKQKLGLVAL